MVVKKYFLSILEDPLFKTFFSKFKAEVLFYVWNEATFTVPVEQRQRIKAETMRLRKEIYHDFMINDLMGDLS